MGSQAFRGKDLSWFDDRQVLADVAKIAEKSYNRWLTELIRRDIIPPRSCVSWR